MTVNIRAFILEWLVLVQTFMFTQHFLALDSVTCREKSKLYNRALLLQKALIFAPFIILIPFSNNMWTCSLCTYNLCMDILGCIAVYSLTMSPILTRHQSRIVICISSISSICPNIRALRHHLYQLYLPKVLVTYRFLYFHLYLFAKYLVAAA